MAETSSPGVTSAGAGANDHVAAITPANTAPPPPLQAQHGGLNHFSPAALLAFEVADMDDVRERIERLADNLFLLTDEGGLPSYFGKVSAEYRERRRVAMPAKRRSA